MRCLTLADMLSSLGWDCAFASAAESTSVVPAMATSGHSLSIIEPPRDADQMRTLWQGCDLLIVDHYDRDRNFEQLLRPWAKKLLVIDDLHNRPHACDALLDQTYGRVAADYAGLHDGPCLCGSAYALLRPAFQAWRERALARRDGRPVERILVSLGAVDAANLTMLALEAVAMAAPGVAVDVVLGSASPNLAAVHARIAELPNDIDLHVDTNDMANLLADADLAIGAPGTSSWERCCLAVPTILVTVAENQRENAQALAAAGAAMDAGWHAEISARHLAGQVARLMKDGAARQEMAQRAAAICDGRGAFRTALALLSVAQGRDGGAVQLRSAEYVDAALMLDWQRDPETRRFARNPNVPTETEHRAWLRRKLAEPGCLFTLVEHDGSPAGILRLDRQAGARPAYEISIVTAPAKRGRGIAPAALTLARELAPGADLVAAVLPGNTASAALFERAGYVRQADGLFHHHARVH